jgi:hypothetical protein
MRSSENRGVRATTLCLLAFVLLCAVAGWRYSSWPAEPAAAQDLGVWTPGGSGRPANVVNRRPVAPRIAERAQRLKGEHDRFLRSIPVDFPHRAPGSARGEAGEPPRMDSGDPNPDRINQLPLAIRRNQPATPEGIGVGSSAPPQEPQASDDEEEPQ